jgi:hypothetical protein
MARVKVFDVRGVRMVFYSGDHWPPHFHARRGREWHAKVFILESKERMIQLIGPRGARIKAADRRAITEGVEEHRAELLEEWESCQSSD